MGSDWHRNPIRRTPDLGPLHGGGQAIAGPHHLLHQSSHHRRRVRPLVQQRRLLWHRVDLYRIQHELGTMSVRREFMWFLLIVLGDVLPSKTSYFRQPQRARFRPRLAIGRACPRKYVDESSNLAIVVPVKERLCSLYVTNVDANHLAMDVS